MTQHHPGGSPVQPENAAPPADSAQSESSAQPDSPAQRHAACLTAEQLMRSRFEAFRDGDAEYLMATWHPQHRPASLELDDAISWRGLAIVDTVRGSEQDADGVVEFRAVYTDEHGRAEMHERSRFLREDGLWFYTEGEVYA